MRRVVVTGIGAVSPLGNTIGETWRRLILGESGISTITKFDATAFPSRMAGEVRGFCGDDWMAPRDAALCDGFLHYAVATATMALNDSRLLETPGAGAKTGTLMATASGGVNVLMAQQANLIAKGPRYVSPMTVPFSICDMASGYVSIKHKLEGPNHSLVSACASGASAIGEAFEMIRRGAVDAMVAGASEVILPLFSAAFAAARALSTSNEHPEKACGPFDSGRDGFVIAEGSASLVLEEMEYARARGASIYGELVGYGSCADTNHITAPDPGGRGAIRAMMEAIEMASIDPVQIGYVNAHATSTPLGDKIEAAAIHHMFGKHVDDLPVSSTKSMTGHMIGAAGTIEAIFCLLAMRDGVLPPTINQENLDPDCNIDTIPNVARTKNIEFAITNSFGFGGHNVSLVLRRPD